MLNDKFFLFNVLFLVVNEFVLLVFNFGLKLLLECVYVILQGHQLLHDAFKLRVPDQFSTVQQVIVHQILNISITCLSWLLYRNSSLQMALKLSGRLLLRLQNKVVSCNLSLHYQFNYLYFN